MNVTIHSLPESDPRTDAVFKALASHQRREILRILGAEDPDDKKTCCDPGEICACRLGERLGLAPSTITHHMSLLRRAGLVHMRRDAQWAYYRIDRERLREVVAALKRI